MNFRISSTFTDSLARLTSEEQKAVKTSAFNLQLDPKRPGLKLHKIDGAQDKNFWSIRVSRDLRLIIHKANASFLLCYVAHHDAAYRWAIRRRFEPHPKTGAAQIVEIQEIVRKVESKIKTPPYAKTKAQDNAVAAHAKAIFADTPEDLLLGYGVPVKWMEAVKQATENTLLDIADHLPAEASEALLELATGGTPKQPTRTAQDVDPFAHPDAQRRFRTMANAEELTRALDYPWEKWTIFLHPAQRQMIKRDYHGPVRISGSAGTGKTVVALHRAVHLARARANVRILLATFSETLANVLRAKIKFLIGNQPSIAKRLEVCSMSSIGRRLYEANLGRLDLATERQIRELLDQVASKVSEHGFNRHVLWTEWSKVIDAWQLKSWEDYRKVPRLGRRTRLAETQRAVIWPIFSKMHDSLAKRNVLTESGMFHRLEQHFSGTRKLPFEFCVIDEAQDVSVAELRFLSALGSDVRDRLFFVGDLGQRIFQTPFSWRALGVDIRGRSHTLRINYRTSHQIRRQADCLLPGELTDVDGIAERRHDTISVLNGPDPQIRILRSVDEESDIVAEWLVARRKEGYASREIGVFVRSEAEMERAINAIRVAKLSARKLGEYVGRESDKIAAGTMHLTKGLEFRAVAVMACDDEVMPLQSRIENAADHADLEDVYDTERNLLYVACTRARDCLLVTGVEPASEFLDDLQMRK